MMKISIPLLLIALFTASCTVQYLVGDEEKNAQQETTTASTSTDTLPPNAEEGPEFQRFPEGVKEAVHRRIPAEGGRIDQVRVEPPYWWVDMTHPTLEVMIYDQAIKGYRASINYPGITVKKTHKVENRNYAFIELDIEPGTQPGKFNILLTRGDDVRSYPYELKKRNKENRILGIDPSDLIYLIMPDRFANGDPSNDSFDDMAQRGTDRDKLFFRHGGDLQGIIDRLDYLQDLGVTALWLNPVLENDQPYDSYHGYALTDHYNIDQRFGDNDLYVELVEQCHARGMKVIMDIIHNHVGDQHWMIRDLPAEDMIHQFDAFTKTSYRAPTLMDPYAAKADQMIMSDAWFDRHMPDLNQQNPRMANYLLQNNIWWVEHAGIDGYRIDTYAYPDQAYMAKWGERIQAEFPSLGIYGETWVHGATIQAFFSQNNRLNGQRNSNLPGVTDFQLYYAIDEALKQEQGWTSGVSRIYYTLAKDYIYEDPYRNVLFLDNHDLSRFYSSIGQDDAKYRSGISLLMTLRGIPMLYYGTEIKMEGAGGAFGEGGRIDFPGGWPGDSSNKFNAKGRTAEEQASFEFVRKLAQFRKNSSALHRGKLMQFVPEDNLYVYFRYDDKQTIMILMNTAGEEKIVDTKRYAERMQGFKRARDVVSEESLSQVDQIRVGPNSVRVLELQP
ncbi:MAG: glycoside hydrolase family 13 protein [Bacteroidota bacterium]